MPSVRVGGRVAVLRGTRDLVLDQRDVPKPRAEEALVRIRRAGICGTDIHAYLGRFDRVPITLGHDASGTVAALGPGRPREEIALGQRVTIEPTLSCGRCDRCRAGNRQLCPSSGYLGMTCDGVFADYIALPADRLVALPDAVSDTAATALEPVAVALHMIDRVGGFTALSRDAHVIGAGPLGVLLAQAIAAAGWHVTLYEPVAYRRQLAGELGLDARDADPAVAPPGDPVLVVETSASAGGIDLARRLAAAGSVIAIIGRAPAEVPTAEVLLGELAVVGVRSGSGCYPAAIRRVASGSVTPERVVTHRYAIDEIGAAMAFIAASPEQVMRSVIEFDGDVPSDHEVTP